jgi:hypothetical protein
MKEFIRQRLLEAIKDIKHFVKQRYPERITALLDQIGDEGKKIIDERIDFIESLEFGDSFGRDLGIIIYDSKEPIKPNNDLPGHLLVLVVKDNVITTLFWKHIVKGQYDYVIPYEKLIEFVNSGDYGTEKRPITIDGLRRWSKEKNVGAKEKKESFKKMKLSNGEKVHFYQTSNRFETDNGEPIELADIFNELPSDDIMLSVFKNANDDEKMDLISVMPKHLSDTAEELLEESRKKRK